MNDEVKLGLPKAETEMIVKILYRNCNWNDSKYYIETDT